MLNPFEVPVAMSTPYSASNSFDPNVKNNSEQKSTKITYNKCLFKCRTWVRAGVTPSPACVSVVYVIILTELLFAIMFSKGRPGAWDLSLLLSVRHELHAQLRFQGSHFRCLLFLFFCLTFFSQDFISFNKVIWSYVLLPLHLCVCAFNLSTSPSQPCLSWKLFSVTLSFHQFMLLILPQPLLPYLLLCARPNAVSVCRARHWVPVLPVSKEQSRLMHSKHQPVKSGIHNTERWALDFFFFFTTAAINTLYSTPLL